MNASAAHGRTALGAVCLCLVLTLAVGCGVGREYDYKSARRALAAEAPAAARSTRRVNDPAPAVELPSRLTLRRAVALALAHSPDVDAAMARIRQAEAMVDQTQAAFWPMVSVELGYSLGDAPSAYLFKKIDQRLLPPAVNFNDPGHFQNWHAGLQGRWNLFRGGRDYLAWRMAATGAELARLARQAVDNALVASVVRAFYNCLAAREFAAIAAEHVATVDKQLELTKVRFEGGGALKSDVLSLEVRLAQAREERVRADNAHRLALAALANVLGADPDAEFKPVEGPEPQVDAPRDYARGVAVAFSLRPELDQARLNVVKAAMGVDKARGGFLPRVDAMGRLYVDDPDAQWEADRANWTAGATLSWDIFTGLSDMAAVRRARAVAAEVLAADRKAALGVKLEVKQAYLDVAAARARCRVTGASVASAQESLKLVHVQYKGGAATITRYLGAELDVNRARVRAAAARYDLRKADADLGRALGLWAAWARQWRSEHGRNEQ